MKKIFILTIILTLFVMSLSLTGCSKETSLTKINLAEVTHSIFYAPQYVALAKGFFTQEGLEINLTNANGGDKTMTALLSGAADIILVGTETTVYVYSQNAKDPAINFAQLTQRDGSFLVSRTPLNNFSWDMLKGKVLLGQRKGGMPEMVSEFVQKKKGIIPFKDVEILQNIEFKNLGPAFIAGTGDFVQLFEPVATKIELEKKGYVVASFGLDSGKLPYTVYITKQSYIDKNREVIEKFTRAIYQAQKWVATHSAEEIAVVIQPYFSDVELKVLTKVVERYKNQDTWATDPLLDEEEYHNLEAVMESAGELKVKVPYEKIVNTEFANKVIGK